MLVRRIEMIMQKVEFHGGCFARVMIRVLIRVPSETAAAKPRNTGMREASLKVYMLSGSGINFQSLHTFR